MLVNEEISESPDHKKQLIILFGIGIIFVASLIGGLFFANQYKKNLGAAKTVEAPTPVQSIPTASPALQPTPLVSQNTSPSNEPKTIFSLNPSPQLLKVGEAKTIDVILSDLPVTAVDIVLNYDPKVFEMSNLVNGTVFTRVIRKRIENGQILYSASVNPEEKDNLKTGTVFTITVTAKKPATTASLLFDRGNTIAALQGKNTIGLPIDGLYRVE